MLQPPGASRQRAATSSSRRKTATVQNPDIIIRQLNRRPPNKKCADCTSKLPSCVNLTTRTFVCMSCAGVHRELNARIKSIGHSAFTAEDIQVMEATDNDQVNSVYLARYNGSTERTRAPTDNRDPRKLKAWIFRKYKDRSWYSGSGAPQATLVQIPPKQQQQQPVVDLFGADFSSSPAPAPPQKQQGGWDAFGGSSGNNRVSHPAPQPQPQHDFPADLGSSQARAPQQHDNFANFGTQLPQQQHNFANFLQGGPVSQQPPQQNFANFQEGAPAQQHQQQQNLTEQAHHTINPGQQPSTQQQPSSFMNHGQPQQQKLHYPSRSQQTQQQHSQGYSQQPRQHHQQAFPGQPQPQQQQQQQSFPRQSPQHISQMYPQQLGHQQFPQQTGQPQQPSFQQAGQSHPPQSGVTGFAGSSPQQQQQNMPSGVSSHSQTQSVQAQAPVPASQQSAQQTPTSPGFGNIGSQTQSQTPGFAAFAPQMQQQPTTLQAPSSPAAGFGAFGSAPSVPPPQMVQQPATQQPPLSPGFGPFGSASSVPPPQMGQQPATQQSPTQQPPLSPGFGAFGSALSQQQQQAALQAQKSPGFGAFGGPPVASVTEGQTDLGLPSPGTLASTAGSMMQGTSRNGLAQEEAGQTLQLPNLSPAQGLSGENETRSGKKTLEDASADAISAMDFGPSPPAMAPSGPTQVADQASSVREEQKKHPNRYEPNEKVYYQSASFSGGAEILKVHLDDALEPFYTIRVQGKEKQTDDGHLTKLHPLVGEITAALFTMSLPNLQHVKRLVQDLNNGKRIDTLPPSSATNIIHSFQPAAQPPPPAQSHAPRQTTESGSSVFTTPPEDQTMPPATSLGNSSTENSSASLSLQNPENQSTSQPAAGEPNSGLSTTGSFTTVETASMSATASMGNQQSLGNPNIGGQMIDPSGSTSSMNAPGVVRGNTGSSAASRLDPGDPGIDGRAPHGLVQNGTGPSNGGGNTTSMGMGMGGNGLGSGSLPGGNGLVMGNGSNMSPGDDAFSGIPSPPAAGGAAPSLQAPVSAMAELPLTMGKQTDVQRKPENPFDPSS